MAATKKAKRKKVKKKVVPMPRQARDASGSTPVTICGLTYHLRGHGDPEYLQELARIVDGKMRELAKATRTSDTTKVAVLAALNLADDCMQAGRKDVTGSPMTGDAEKRLDRLVTILDEALAG